MHKLNSQTVLRGEWSYTEAYCHIPPVFRCTRGKGQHPLLLLLTSVIKYSRLIIHSAHIVGNDYTHETYNAVSKSATILDLILVETRSCQIAYH